MRFRDVVQYSTVALAIGAATALLLDRTLGDDAAAALERLIAHPVPLLLSAAILACAVVLRRLQEAPAPERPRGGTAPWRARGPGQRPRASATTSR